jgi:alpha-glucosidase
LLRPLLWEWPGDKQAVAVQDQAMLGPTLMAAPVLAPAVRARAVYLPEGEWYDWYTGERHAGPGHVLLDAPLDRLPLLARAGGVAALGPPHQTTAASAPDDPLTLRLWPGEGTWVLHEDDGTPARRQWWETAIALRRVRAGLQVDLARRGSSSGVRPVLTLEAPGHDAVVLGPDTSDRSIALQRTR